MRKDRLAARFLLALLAACSSKGSDASPLGPPKPDGDGGAPGSDAACAAPVAKCAAPTSLEGPPGENTEAAKAPGHLFQRISIQGITNEEGASGNATQGAAFEDFDGDGRPDLLLVKDRTPAPASIPGDVRLLLNKGCFTFAAQPITLTSDAHASGNVATAADFDGDGKMDFYLTDSGTNQHARLFMGGATFHDFIDVSAMGVANTGAYNHGTISVGDLDGDGFLDLGVGANQIGNGASGRPFRRVYRYTPAAGGAWSAGTFTDIGGNATILPGFSQTKPTGCDPAVDRAGAGVLFRDLDDDGDLDILQGASNDMTGARWDDPCADGEWYYGVYAWRNQLKQGSPKFEQIVPGPDSIAEIGKMRYDSTAGYYKTEQAAFGPIIMNAADVDNDGDLDVIGVTPTDLEWHVQSNLQSGKFWYNDGNFKFREATSAAGLDALNWTYGDWQKHWHTSLKSTAALMSGACSISNQKPLCKDLTVQDHQFMAGSGVLFGDFDNDGFIDFLLIDRHEISELYKDLRNVLFFNKRDGTFEPATTEVSGIDSNSIGAGMADLDGDGLLDLYFPASASNSGGTVGGPPPADRNTDKVYWNTGAARNARANHWLTITLAGAPSTKLIGAKLFLEDANGKILGRRDYFPTQGSYKVSLGLEQHFGLGTNCEARLRVGMPDGQTLRVGSVPVDARLAVDVGTKAVTRRP